MRPLFLLFVLLLSAASVVQGQEHPNVSTFSIVACDSVSNFLGVAVQSRVVSAGSIVPAAQAEIGAIATQAAANVGYKAEALRMLRERKRPEEIRAHLFGRTLRFRRASSVLPTAAATSQPSQATAPSPGPATAGRHYSVQGNILTGPEVVDAMARAYEEAETRRLPFGERLLASLKAGQEAGGDKRGRQAAGLLIVKPRGGYGGRDDRYADLRVEDHPEPILELERVYRVWMSTFHPYDHFLPNGSEVFGVPTGPHICTLRNRLAQLGFGTRGLIGSPVRLTKR